MESKSVDYLTKKSSLMMVLDKILLGITLAAPIGPVSVEMIKRGLNHGFWAAFVVRLGGSIGNTLCLLGAYFGLSTLMSYPAVTHFMGFLGSLILVYIGVKTLSKNPLPTASSLQTNSGSSVQVKNGILTGLILALANPIAIVFWLGIFAASMALEEHLAFSFRSLAENFLIIVGVLMWGVFLCSLLTFSKKMLNPRITQFITFIAGVSLILYGFKYGYVTAIKIF